MDPYTPSKMTNKSLEQISYLHDADVHVLYQ